jgi:Protein of unknown function (DUF1800)
LKYRASLPNTLTVTATTASPARARPRAHRQHGAATGSSLPVYKGPFREHHAERLLWRAGFGPRPGQARKLAHLGMRGAVLSLTRPRNRSLSGPKPVNEKGQPIAPYDVWGNDVLWWLDRMVRSNSPLIERMTLIWHDWFATSNEGVNSQRMMIAQNHTQRNLCLAGFPAMLSAMTTDPAMLVWLSGVGSTKEAPNENYAREMQELFTLGVGNGYTEKDVREHARALTGWTNKWNEDTGQPEDFHLDASLHDDGVKTIYGQKGRFGWRDSVRLALEHPDHPAHFVTRLWSHFCPQPLPASHQKAAEGLYLSSGKSIKTVVEAMLMHPLIHDGPRMVKPPIVQIAGMLRGIGRYIDTEAWSWESSITGQMPFYPPNVAGWEAERWLNTGTWQARFNLASQMIDDKRAIKAPKPKPGSKAKPPKPAALLEKALQFWGSPTISQTTRRALLDYAKAAAVDATKEDWEREQYPWLALGALRALVAASPDYQTS